MKYKAPKFHFPYLIYRNSIQTAMCHMQQDIEKSRMYLRQIQASKVQTVSHPDQVLLPLMR